MGRVTLHRVNLSLGWRAHRGVSLLPRPTGHVEHPQLVCHVPPAGLQFATEHIDVILKRRGGILLYWFKQVRGKS